MIDENRARVFKKAKESCKIENFIAFVEFGFEENFKIHSNTAESI